MYESMLSDLLRQWNRYKRLEYLREHAQQMRANETDEQRQLRLQLEREASSCRRQTVAMTKKHHLHEGGWAESQQQLHDQPWAQQEIMSFHHKHGSIAYALSAMSYGQHALP